MACPNYFLSLPVSTPSPSPSSPTSSCPLTRHTLRLQTAGTFADQYKQELEKNENINASDFAGPTFDAVYAAAIALNDSIPILGPDLKLEDFNFGDLNSSKQFASVIRRNLAKVNFSGVSVSCQIIN